MPGSSVTGGWRSATLALRNVMAMLVLLGFATLTFSEVAKRLAYRTDYQFIPGQYTGKVLQQIRSEQAPSRCVILGASTAREGFDVRRLSELVDQTRFYSIATTAAMSAGGVLNMQAQVLDNFAYRFDCIVLGLHPFMLFKTQPKSMDVFKSDYASQLSTAQVFEFERAESAYRPLMWGRVVAHATIPNARHAPILRKHLFNGLFEAESLLSGNNPPLSKYELRRNELGHYGTVFRYLDKESRHTPRFFERREQRLKGLKADQPGSYRDPLSLALFRDTIQTLSELTDRLVIVSLPTSAVFDTVNAVSTPFFEAELARFSGRVEYVICDVDAQPPADVFHDTIHVKERGRHLLTNSLAALLIDDTAPGTICSRRSL